MKNLYFMKTHQHNNSQSCKSNFSVLMKWIFTISLIVLLISCKRDIVFCLEQGEIEKETTIKMINSKSTNGLLPFSNFEGIFQYRGHDSWGWFDHTIRLTRIKNSYLLQLIDQRKDPKTRKGSTIYKEYLIGEEQIDSIIEMINLLQCKPVFLESGAGVDGNYYELLIKEDSKVQGFKWQNLIDVRDSKEAKILKKEIANLVGQVMRLCEFSNGSKVIIPNSKGKTSDSLEYDVFLTNQFNLLDYEVYFDGKKMLKNSDRISRISVHKKDTLQLNKRIIVRTELLDGEIIDL